MRRQISLKPSTYPEGIDVYVAGISEKVSVHYPGRSVQNSGQKSAEAIVSQCKRMVSAEFGRRAKRKMKVQRTQILW